MENLTLDFKRLRKPQEVSGASRGVCVGLLAMFSHMVRGTRQGLCESVWETGFIEVTTEV